MSLEAALQRVNSKFQHKRDCTGEGREIPVMPPIGLPTEIAPLDVEITVVRFEPVIGHSTSSMDEAIADWENNMDGFCSGKEQQIFWRKFPEADSEKDYETTKTHYKVYSRVACV